MIKKLLLSAALLTSSLTFAQAQSNQSSVLTKVTTDDLLIVNKEAKGNVFVIAGPIMNGLGEGADLGPIAFKMKKLLEKKQEAIILISSPGGVLDPVSEDFIKTLDSFKEQSVPVTCIVDQLAASLATVIYSKCSNRYALPSSRIMWHSALTMYQGKLNESIAKEIYEHFKEVNTRLWKDAKSYFKEEYFLKHFLAEDLILATELEVEGDGFCKIIAGALLSN